MGFTSTGIEARRSSENLATSYAIGSRLSQPIKIGNGTIIRVPSIRFFQSRNLPGAFTLASLWPYRNNYSADIMGPDNEKVLLQIRKSRSTAFSNATPLLVQIAARE